MSKKLVKLVVRKDKDGKHYWDSDLPWWVPHANLELTSQSFREGTTLLVEEEDAKNIGDADGKSSTDAER